MTSANPSFVHIWRHARIATMAAGQPHFGAIEPATGVVRHADANYEDAIACAREYDLMLHGILG